MGSPGGNEAPLRFRYPAIRAYERLAGSRTNPRVYLWVVTDRSQTTRCKYAQKLSILAEREDSNRQFSNRTGRPGSGRCIRFEMDRGPKAGYRGGALQSCGPAAIDETPGRLVNSRAATTQNTQKRPRPGHEKPAARSGRAWLDAGISELLPNGPPPSSGNVGYARILFRPQGEGRPPKADSSTTSGCREPSREGVAAGRLGIYFSVSVPRRMVRSTSASLRGSVSAGFGRSPCFPV